MITAFPKYKGIRLFFKNGKFKKKSNKSITKVDVICDDRYLKATNNASLLLKSEGRIYMTAISPDLFILDRGSAYFLLSSASDLNIEDVEPIIASNVDSISIEDFPYSSYISTVIYSQENNTDQFRKISTNDDGIYTELIYKDILRHFSKVFDIVRHISDPVKALNLAYSLYVDFTSLNFNTLKLDSEIIYMDMEIQKRKDMIDNPDVVSSLDDGFNKMAYYLMYKILFYKNHKPRVTDGVCGFRNNLAYG